jgi:serine/threonine protein kinase/tetratricopeptide (TPR) repeat protein
VIPPERWQPSSASEVVPLKPGTRLGTYEILTPLGIGGMGEVYRARDEKLGRDVAIKVLPAELAQDPARRKRFETEAQAASALNHPNIITIHDIGQEGPCLYILMELVSGKTLRSLLDEGPLSPNVLVRFARQLAEGLAKAHAAGIVHRDLKPQNVMVTDDGYIKILDFGLAKVTPVELAADEPERESESPTLVKGGTRPGTVLGTVGYMSPEQARGEEADHRSDQFSLGAILYEMATGRRAFQRQTAVQTLSAILESQPQEMALLSGTVSEPFHVVVERCLSKQRAARYEKTAELADALARIQDGFSPTTARAPRIEAPKKKRLTVGRKAIFTELQQGLDKVKSGTGLLLCVAGEAGIGKTTVAETFLSTLTDESSDAVRIARGRCSDRLAGTEAYLPVLEVLESLLRDPTLAEAMKRKAPSWYGQVAHLTPDPERGASGQERLKRELGGFLQEITRNRPFVIFLDDLHWADVSTVDLIGYLAMHFDSMKLLVVATYRKDEMRSSQHPFLDLLMELQSRGVCRELAVPFLDRADVRHYVDLAFPGHDFGAGFLELLHAKTEGSPLFLVDLLRYLQDRGIIEALDRRYRLSRALEEMDQELPQSILGMIERKVERLEHPDRKLLELASVQGLEFDTAVLSKVVARDALDVEESLQNLERLTAFIEGVREDEFPDGTLNVRYRFVHVLYQNALDDSLSPSRRVSWSRQVAEALEGFLGDKGGERASELTFLFRAAREWSRAARYARQAAEHAASISANQEAVTLAEQGFSVLENVPPSRARDEMELALLVVLAPALTAIRGWQHEEVERAWRRAGEIAEELGDLEKLFVVRWGLFAHAYVRGNDFTETLDLARRLLPIAERVGDDGLELTARWGVGAALYERGELQKARPELEKGLRLYDSERHHRLALRITDDPGVAIRTYLAMIALLSGFPDSAQNMLEEAWDLAVQLNHPFSQGRVLYVTGWMRHQLADLPGMGDAVDKLLSLCEENAFPLWHTFVNVFAGHMLVRAGKLDEGESRIRASIEALETMGGRHTLHLRLLVLADAMKATGRIEDGLATVADALSYMSRSNARLLESEIHRLQGELLLASGKREPEAEAAYRRAIEIARHQQAKLLELRAAVGLGRFLQERKREREAREMVAPLLGWFTEGLETHDLLEANALLDELS